MKHFRAEWPAAPDHRPAAVGADRHRVRRDGGNADPLSNAVGFITTPIRNGVSAVLDWADGVRAYVFHYEEMEQQIQDLERQVAELEEQAREGQEASRENEQLRELLDLQAKRRDFVFESAKVTARSSTNWDSTLTIGKGSSAGLEVNDCVITETGTLVGVVSEVGLNWSKVSTLINTDIEIGRARSPALTVPGSWRETSP